MSHDLLFLESRSLLAKVYSTSSVARDIHIQIRIIRYIFFDVGFQTIGWLGVCADCSCED